MDNVDRDKLRDVIQRDALLAIHRSHGDAGTRSFRDLALAIHAIFEHIEHEGFDGILVAFKCLDDSDRPLPEKNATVIWNAALLPQEITGDAIIQALADGRFLLWNNVSVNVESVAESAVVYRFHDRHEHFFAGSAESEIPKIGQYASIYAVPAFSDLRQALEHYRTDMAKESSCPFLKTAWIDQNRLFFVNKPERIMRNSLVHFLKITLRDTEVRPEQNMDESHPVDIKVTFFQNRIGVIEIKWLGISKHPNGEISTKYTASRGKDGARQLAEYLDMNKGHAPTHITRGYLVVFDGRRAKLQEDSQQISRIDGSHFRNRDIKFDPEYDVARDDFQTPIRMFLEPIFEP